LNRGEALRIAGANGSGKTSLLRILCGLLPPASGEVRWNGTAVQRLREDFFTRLVYLGHAAAVKDDLSAAENLAITCRLAGNEKSASDIGGALAQFGLAANDQPLKKLSQGQRRRAALARLALSESQPLWLLDEPFAAVDAAGIIVVEGFLQRHLARGGVLAYTTHQDAGITATQTINLT
jgi:heme exporter protein A